MPVNNSIKLAFTIEEGRRAIGLGRTSLYALIKAGELESFKACGRTLIPADALHAYVARARAATSTAATNATANDRSARS